jgi:hypothetical protein
MSEVGRGNGPTKIFRRGRISLRGPRIELQEAEFLDTSIKLRLVVADRDSGLSKNLVFYREFPPTENELHYVHEVKRTLREFINHELCELLCIDDARIEDPHAGEVR